MIGIVKTSERNESEQRERKRKRDNEIRFENVRTEKTRQ